MRILALLVLGFHSLLSVADDERQLVEMPDMMKNHMLQNMRGHLEVVNQLLMYLSQQELDKASELAENELGMSSLDSHKAKHMSQFMPEGMRKAGTSMHKAASQFALVAEEGDVAEAYKSLINITSACVACHAAYRVR